MISEETIQTLTNKYQTNEINVRREYLQHLLLSYFYQQKEASNIYFKGGTALRVIFNSPRFSEDLDFSASEIDIKGIEGVLLDTLAQIEKENIAVTLKESKQTSDGFLAIISFEALGQSTDVQLDISQRVGQKIGEIVAVDNDFIPAYNVVVLQPEQLVDEKIQALLTRKKPRDFYDFYFILRSKKLLPPQKKNVLPQILKVLQSSDINFEKELKQFLPKSHWAIIRNFKASLESEIKRFI